MELHANETGQMHKFEQGKLKIQMAIDLSVSGGLLVDKEYKCFCKCGKHLNIDHTNIAIKSSLAHRLLTICYQNETCRKGVTSVSIFTDEKCHFYRIFVGFVSYVNCLSLKKYFLKSENTRPKKKQK